MQTFLQQPKTTQLPSPELAALSAHEAKEVVPTQSSDAPIFSPSTSSSHSLQHIPVHARAPVALQSKLRVNTLGDQYEQEADRVADQVMRTSEMGVQRACSCDGEGGQGEEEGTRGAAVQRKPVGPLMRFGGETDVAGQTAPPSVYNVLASSGQPLDPVTRSFMEPRFGRDFSGVRVHTDQKAAESAQGVNARAYTVGRDVVFGAGQYAPQSSSGRRLIAHELTHVVQQGAAGRTSRSPQSLRSAPPVLNRSSGFVQRDIPEAKLASTPVETIMADPNYFENGIKNIEFYSAELAIIQYTDGTSIRLGLVPQYIEAPFQAVDYRTPKSTHLTVSPTSSSLGTGSIAFLPRGSEAKFPAGMTFGDLPKIVKDVGRTIQFTHHKNGRIVPTEVNSISAPRLTKALRQAEAEYVRQFDAMSKGAVEVLEKLEWIILLASIAGGLLAAGARSAAGRTAASRAGASGAAKVAGRAQSTLSRFFKGLLKSGSTAEITVEGVGFSGVRAAVTGTELTVTRSVIVNASKIPGQGRLIHGAFERAAIQVAKESGLKSARVSLELVQNAKWASYLEGQGYAFEVFIHKTGATRVLTKVFTL